jgi:hypothetical protein
MIIMDDGSRPADGLGSEDPAWQKEAEERWGRTEAYRQSRERVAKFTKDDWKRISGETDVNLRALVALMTTGKKPGSPEVQAEVARHHAGIGRFYDCSIEIYRGLADLYLADQRFADFYRKYHAELPEFLAVAMRAYCDRKR